MKIVNLKTFLKLPKGTLFAKCKPETIGDIEIKGENCGIDFFSQDIKSFQAGDSNESSDRFSKMIEQGASYPIELNCEGRD
jgi:hypothetical protein